MRPPSASTCGWITLGVVAAACVLSLPWTLGAYDLQRVEVAGKLLAPPSLAEPFGTDALGRSVLARCLLGGAISLGIGLAAALLAVLLGTAWGLVAGYAGGKVDAVMMRLVDVLYGLPYLLMVVLLGLAVAGVVAGVDGWGLAQEEAAEAAGLPAEPWFFVAFVREQRDLVGLLTLVVALGGVSWLTMARVVRGQTLSIRRRPFIEATRALGLPLPRVLLRHVLPHLAGPVVVYATLAVPTAILQESFLSFLGIGVRAPLPSWGNLAAEGVAELGALAIPGLAVAWWLPLFPCGLLGVTLLGLNLAGDGLQSSASRG
ncbi:ABC transporter permease [Phycisphaera mikurensis]|uniref:Putative ABC transporter permease protein n=1 Tax=Phycisphaera mikurensis (strain NBRC 102666 / KCTC 22515 / FYK2301M01) TaxID=1142394 RepID=I0IC98_PHYMF|nr:ABC transporter permease [Phycisphaera mikurensis]MBB6441895.1 ABC-type dipeptide/oligopeptide/nickel transport system permease subunit [Phycisphaera mikurensis]BAM02886.1 putative ABC transporter permease protein [Phycisphaera mikurensis NBRC 102666]